MGGCLAIKKATFSKCNSEQCLRFEARDSIGRAALKTISWRKSGTLQIVDADKSMQCSISSSEVKESTIISEVKGIVITDNDTEGRK